MKHLVNIPLDARQFVGLPLLLLVLVVFGSPVDGDLPPQLFSFKVNSMGFSLSVPACTSAKAAETAASNSFGEEKP